MIQSAPVHMTEDEFFEFVRTRDERWELIDGEPVMMTGGSQRHSRIKSNVHGSLYPKLRGGKCRPGESDLAVATVGGNIRYPDVIVDCGPPNDMSYLATAPTLVVEVLSPSTREFDSHRKVLEYKANPDIRYILLIDTNEACALLHRRADDVWVEALYNSYDDVIDLPEIGAALALSDIYYGIEIKPKLVIERSACSRCGMNPCTCGGGGSSGPGF